jgi:hypothetical protein
MLRTDWHSHERTIGLSPLARDLMVQAITSNIAGILERSTRKMATVAGGRTSADDVDRAVCELVDRGLARWWPDLETLWIIEAADEQARNVKAWISAEALVTDAEPEIRTAFAERYRDRVSDRLSGRVSGTLFRQEQEQEQLKGCAASVLAAIPQADSAFELTPPTARLPPSPAAHVRRRDALSELWAWFEGECRERGYGRDTRKLSTKWRRLIDATLKHVRETLGTDYEGALDSQRRHLAWRMDASREDEGTRSRIRDKTAWGEAWWSWWHAHVVDSPRSTPGPTDADRTRHRELYDEMVAAGKIQPEAQA